MTPSNGLAWALPLRCAARRPTSKALKKLRPSSFRCLSIPHTKQFNTVPSHFRARITASHNRIASNRACYSTQNDQGPLRVAIIGSGPAGFYSARRLMQRVDNAHVDMYEQLPVPFGLVRFGVAPDHPEVKNCEDTFNEVASSPRFRFLGNVSVGQDIDLVALRQAYDAVVFAYGAARDRTLGIPGEDKLGGIYSARAFVGWYNGLPEYAGLNPDLQAGDTAVVIGQGNVALDVARVLLSSVDKLRSTDMASNALEALSTSKVKRVHVVGRRGPMQAAFTIKELRELMQLNDVGFEPLQAGLMPDDLKTLPRAKRRIAELLRKHSNAAQSEQSESSKSWSLDFMRSPRALLSSADYPHQLSSVEFTHTRYADDAEDVYSPDAPVVSTDNKSRLDAALAFRSIGYKSISIPGMQDLGISFDARRGIVPNIAGRVITSTGEHIDGLYCTGWVKNGPTGVIATTMEDAFGAAETLVEDWTTGSIKHESGREGWEQIRDLVRSRHVNWQDWLKIDAVEKTQGQARGKAREKLSSVDAMLAVL